MALNMDDLIGSMQHGFHAGDRGNELNEIRESLKVSLGQQPYPQQSQQQLHRSQQQQQRPQWDPRSSQYSHTSIDGNVAIFSGGEDQTNGGSSSRQPWPSYQHQQPQTSNFYGASSYGSQRSAGSSNLAFGAPGNAPAPANTPQQTPVETSALARQLQSELERARETHDNHYITEVDERAESQDWPPSANISPVPAHAALTSSPPPSSSSQSTRQLRERTGSPRQYVNGFSPTPN